MLLKRLILKNFRTYSDLSLSFKTRLVFFIGDNGEGKTNLLESISILSGLKSFRGNSDDEVTKWNENGYYIGSLLTEDEEEYKLEFGYESQPTRRKKIKLNGNIFKKQADAFGFLPCIVLSPFDLIIVEGSHTERRKFVDHLLSYLNKNYLNTLNEYNRLIKQRNASLKTNQIKKELLLVWDKMLCEKDDFIRNERNKFINELNELFQKNLKLLSGDKDNFQLYYKPNVNSVNEYQEKIRMNFEKDLRVGYSTVGCHRDEILIGQSNRDILEFGSQGQKRSTVISLKTASFELIRRKLKKDPILLIDDVIRELDVKRRQFFVDLIRECGQAFFTTTDLEGIQDYIGNLSEPKQIFSISQGGIEELK
jgi:DNA replication and repair protein RecF